MARNPAMRHQRYQYLNVGTSMAPDWVQIGPMFAEFNDSLNPVTDETTYISDRSASTTVTAYAPSWAFTCHVDENDEAVAFLRGVGEGLLTGADAETEVVMYDGWDIEPDFTVPAKMFRVACAIDYTSNGGGGEKLECAGTLFGLGDPVVGTWDTVTGSFTEAP